MAMPDEPPPTDVVRFLAAWALLHESADDAWKGMVQRGRSLEPGEMREGEAFADGLAALVADETDRMRTRLAGGVEGVGGEVPRGDLTEALDALRFEVAELRGRLESLQASVDALASHRED